MLSPNEPNMLCINSTTRASLFSTESSDIQTNVGPEYPQSLKFRYSPEVSKFLLTRLVQIVLREGIWEREERGW